MGETRPAAASNTDTSSSNAQRILQLAAKALPVLASADVAGMSVGFRPYPADGYPCCGWLPRCANAYVAGAGGVGRGFQLQAALSEVTPDMPLLCAPDCPCSDTQRHDARALARAARNRRGDGSAAARQRRQQRLRRRVAAGPISARPQLCCSSGAWCSSRPELGVSAPAGAASVVSVAASSSARTFVKAKRLHSGYRSGRMQCLLLPRRGVVHQTNPASSSLRLCISHSKA
jgi:hypothetical protein